MIYDATEKQMKAFYVFTAALKYLKEFLFNEELPNRGHRDEVFDNDITWVITVPAIWDNAAKQFMRNAAIEVNSLEADLQQQLNPVGSL